MLMITKIVIEIAGQQKGASPSMGMRRGKSG
jgi:hypothetical protein